MSRVIPADIPRNVAMRYEKERTTILLSQESSMMGTMIGSTFIGCPPASLGVCGPEIAGPDRFVWSEPLQLQRLADI